MWILHYLQFVTQYDSYDPWFSVMTLGQLSAICFTHQGRGLTKQLKQKYEK